MIEWFPPSWKFGLVPCVQKNVWFGVVLSVLCVCMRVRPVYCCEGCLLYQFWSSVITFSISVGKFEEWICGAREIIYTAFPALSSVESVLACFTILIRLSTVCN